MVQEVHKNDLTQALAADVAVLDFNATWCNPCKMLAPVLESANQDLEGKALFYGIDVDENLALAQQFGISSIPALVASNLCLGIAPRYYLDPKDTRIRAFALKGHPTWDLCISYRRKSYLSDAASEYIRLAGEYWKQVLPPVQKN